MVARTSVAVLTACLVVSIVLAPSAVAWGPVSQASIVTTAAGVIAKDRAYRRLVDLRRYIRDGAMISNDKQGELFPNFDIRPIATIEREMVLLQSVRSQRIDPYFAYRLGTLGKLVAQVSAPMWNANPTYRDMYYEDVDTAFQRANVDLKFADRILVDPQAYFQRIQREAGAQNTTIEVDYRTGQGFEGYANSALSLDASRSVNAVADVWYTILSDNVTGLDVAQADVRRFHLNGLEFYLARNNLTEADETLQRMQERNLLDADTLKEAGDLFFAAGHEEQAMEQYQAALQLEPGRRDVMDKVALYYEQKGDELKREGELEKARDAYAAAQDANPLHPEAPRKLLTVEDQIEERDARLREARAAIAAGQNALAEAEAAALDRNFAEAITRLRVALRAFGEVSDEFPAEAEVAAQGRRNAELLMRDYKTEFIRSAQDLSGSGFRHDAKRLADNAEDLGERTLRSMLDREYRSRIQELKQTLQQSVGPTP